MLSKEEFAEGMEQRGNYAAVKDVRTNLSEEECAGGMGQNAIIFRCSPARIWTSHCL